MDKITFDILLVEDNIDDAELTLRELKKHRIANNIVHLKDGAEALDLFFNPGKTGLKQPVMPRLILLDIKMPKVSGIEVVRRLKSDERTRAIPIVILTSSREDPDIKSCYDLGVNSYIVKPVNFEQFTNAISQVGMYWLVLNQSAVVGKDYMK